MKKTLSKEDWIEKLKKLGERIAPENLPAQVRKRALAENPWFTSYYIDRALQGIRLWFDPDSLRRFLDRYTIDSARPFKKVGVIAAGNLPLVGFHDALCAVLSGHQLYLKLSHQDRVLMQWVIEEWKDIMPDLNQRLHLVESPQKIDYLIATGSNNTARYVEARYSGIPRLIRKNRFSVAVLNAEVEEEGLEKLCDDMLLYNGLGCRNVSNLILSDGFDWKRLQKKIEEYPSSRVNPHYLERILFNNIRKGVIKKEFITSNFGLFFFGNSLKPMEMGNFQLVKVKDQEEVKKLISDHRHQIQAIVGKEIPFGSTQQPGLSDFADGVDTMEVLTNL